MHRLPMALRGGPIGWLLTLAIAALSSAAPARAADVWPGDVPTGVYRLEPQRSQFIVNLRCLGVSRYPVSFSGMAGRMEASRQVADGPRVSIRVDPNSISNPRSVVSRSMLTLLEPARFPQIGFASRGLGRSNGQIWLLGDLTLHGVTRPIRLTLVLQHTDRGSGGPARFAVYGRGRIRRSDFGMPQMRSLVSDQVDLTFQAEFVQTPAGTRQARGGAPSDPADPGTSDDLE